MELTRGLGLELAVHAIGDAAVRAVLDGWEEGGRKDEGTEARRHGGGKERRSGVADRACGVD